MSPDSKLVFLSQDYDPDVVEEAFSLGAFGYLLKSDAVELPIAINTILQGMRFVSSGLNLSR